MTLDKPLAKPYNFDGKTYTTKSALEKAIDAKAKSPLKVDGKTGSYIKVTDEQKRELSEARYVANGQTPEQAKLLAAKR